MMMDIPKTNDLKIGILSPRQMAKNTMPAFNGKVSELVFSKLANNCTQRYADKGNESYESANFNRNWRLSPFDVRYLWKRKQANIQLSVGG